MKEPHGVQVNRYKNMEKYKLTGKTKVVNGHTLHRIQSLKDFSDVKTGDLGGWIEKKGNLSQYGNCWIYDNAYVYCDACVCDNASVSGNARISGDALVYDNARVSGYAIISNDAIVSWNATVSGYAKISGDSIVLGDASVSGNARISGIAQISGKAVVSKTPLQIRGSKHFVNMNGDKLQIGCKLYTIAYWKAHFKKIGKAEGYSDEQIEEYKLYIDLAEKLMD